MLQEAMEVTDQAPVLSKAQTEERRRMVEWFKEQVSACKKEPIPHFMTLTPVVASILLEHNAINRKVSKRNSANLANDISSGRFVFNGEPIIVSRTGNLLDGQHRCQQVVALGKSIPVLLVFGPHDEARYTIDTGKAKTAPDFLGMQGRKYPGVLSAVAGYYTQWMSSGTIQNGGTQAPTTAARLEVADKMRGVDRSIEMTSSALQSVGSHAVLALCHFVFSKKNRDAADEFISGVLSGEGLSKGSPVLYCRNRLIQFGRGVSARDRTELVIKCWNAWRQSATITSYLKTTGGKLPKVEA